MAVVVGVLIPCMAVVVGVLIPCMAVVVWPYRPSYPYNAGTEHVRFSSTRQVLLSPSGEAP